MMSLAAEFDSLRQDLASASKSPEALVLAAMRVRAFARRTSTYKDRYKSQPGVRKAILYSGSVCLDIADILDQLFQQREEISPETMRKVLGLLILTLRACSLSKMTDEDLEKVRDLTDSAQNTLDTSK